MTDQLNREGVKAIERALQGSEAADEALEREVEIGKLAAQLGADLLASGERSGALHPAEFEHGARAGLGAYRARFEGFDALLTALKKIEEGRGRFSRDHLTHCENTVEDMRTIARDAITAATGEDYPDTLRATEEH